MSINKKILLAEDDMNLGKVLTTYLEAKGYSVKHATNGESAYELFCTSDLDICIVDVMMPLKDGFTLAKEIRKMDKQIPIIFLTAKSLPQDMVYGLSIGGDDYITKPFSMEVLLARLEALIRRTYGTEEGDLQPIQLGSIIFNVAHQSLLINGEEKKLTTRETELLMMLIQKKNDVLDRGYALKKIWGDDSYYNARSMDVYITKLRKLFAPDPKVQIINVHGIGFKLVM
ncbi:MAG: DNA-binding response regulator [Bacteroidetes bacterium HGW-Bacteroidetes-6]|nr:MAG: DNA-binding response regulator [Bacteroidetes bacterium HGW-Bacteroidetes-6]